MTELDEGYTDAELLAEGRMIGSVMVDGELWRQIGVAMPPNVFCVPFHRAVYFAVVAARYAHEEVSPEMVWERVKSHPDAEGFGLDHVVEIAGMAARATGYLDAVSVVLDRMERLSHCAVLETMAAGRVH